MGRWSSPSQTSCSITAKWLTRSFKHFQEMMKDYSSRNMVTLKRNLRFSLCSVVTYWHMFSLFTDRCLENFPLNYKSLSIFLSFNPPVIPLSIPPYICFCVHGICPKNKLNLYSSRAGICSWSDNKYNWNIRSHEERRNKHIFSNGCPKYDQLTSCCRKSRGF